MRVLRGYAGSWEHESTSTALAVGVFDGMHSGHRAVLGELLHRADNGGLVPGVVTFDPHPLAVVAPDRAPAMLTDIEQRIELLDGLGVELVAVVAFDPVTRNWSAEEFAAGLLAERLAARVVLCGEDFRFGRDRSGDAAALRALGETHGFEAVVVPLVGGDRPASSRALRALVAAGEVEAVATELGRPHEVRGLATQRGDTLVVVTPASAAVPARGSYAALLGRDSGESLPGRVRIDDGVEVWSLDADPGFAASVLRVRFVTRITDDATDESIRLALAAQGA